MVSIVSLPCRCQRNFVSLAHLQMKGPWTDFSWLGWYPANKIFVHLARPAQRVQTAAAIDCITHQGIPHFRNEVEFRLILEPNPAQTISIGGTQVEAFQEILQSINDALTLFVCQPQPCMVKCSQKKVWCHQCLVDRNQVCCVFMSRVYHK